MAHFNLSNTGMRQRMTQLLVLIIVIIAGIIFSQPADAQTSNRRMKSKQTRQIASRSNASKACYLLYKKRTSTSSKRPTFASSRTTRRVKYKPMAETDQPMGVASLN